MVDVFTYLDYRKLLQDLYDDKKRREPELSYRFLARNVGFNSAGFFTNILRGKRGISTDIINKFADFFKLKIKERQYFELLVHANQSKNQTQKKYYLDKALLLKKIKFNIKDVDSHVFYNKWYYTAIREILDFLPFKGDDYRILARSLFPPITPKEAKNTVELLEKLNFIKKGKDGVYRQTEAFITSGREITSAALAEFHMATADLAKTAVDKCPSERRNISTLTLGLSDNGYQTVVKKLREFRQELMQVARNDKDKEWVYHLNFHVFPMTKNNREHRP
jgi:uncharacterized protein (TIGR02147 family)